MTAREYPVFTVTPKAERSLRAGHPWVYGEEVTAGQIRATTLSSSLTRILALKALATGG